MIALIRGEKQGLDMSKPKVKRAISEFKKLSTHLGVEVKELPASWKKIKDQKQKYIHKAKYEIKIIDELLYSKIDYLVSDRAMFYFGLVLNKYSPYANRVLNSHPSYISGPCAIFGKQPTLDAIELFKEGRIPNTGSTFHKMTAIVDGGPIVSTIGTPILKTDSVKQLRARNYAGYEAMNQINGLKDITNSGSALSESSILRMELMLSKLKTLISDDDYVLNMYSKVKLNESEPVEDLAVNL